MVIPIVLIGLWLGDQLPSYIDWHGMGRNAGNVDFWLLTSVRRPELPEGVSNVRLIIADNLHAFFGELYAEALTAGLSQLSPHKSQAEDLVGSFTAALQKKSGWAIGSLHALYADVALKAEARGLVPWHTQRFAEYKYWGWCDLDTLWGDIGGTLLPWLADEPDIVTVTGPEDYHRLGPRGMLSVLKNRPATRGLWTEGMVPLVEALMREDTWHESMTVVGGPSIDGARNLTVRHLVGAMVEAGLDLKGSGDFVPPRMRHPGLQWPSRATMVRLEGGGLLRCLPSSRWDAAVARRSRGKTVGIGSAQELHVSRGSRCDGPWVAGGFRRCLVPCQDPIGVFSQDDCNISASDLSRGLPPGSRVFTDRHGRMKWEPPSAVDVHGGIARFSYGSPVGHGPPAKGEAKAVSDSFDRFAAADCSPVVLAHFNTLGYRSWGRPAWFGTRLPRGTLNIGWGSVAPLALP